MIAYYGIEKPRIVERVSKQLSFSF